MDKPIAESPAEAHSPDVTSPDSSCTSDHGGDSTTADGGAGTADLEVKPAVVLVDTSGMVDTSGSSNDSCHETAGEPAAAADASGSIVSRIPLDMPSAIQCRSASPSMNLSVEKQTLASVHTAPPPLEDPQASRHSEAFKKFDRQDSQKSVCSSLVSSVNTHHTQASQLSASGRRPWPKPKQATLSEEARGPDLTFLLQSLIAKGQELQGMILADGHQALKMVAELKSENACLRRHVGQSGASELDAQTDFDGPCSRAQSHDLMPSIASGNIISFTSGIEGIKSGTSATFSHQHSGGSAHSSKQSVPARKKDRAMTDPAKVRALQQQMGAMGVLQQMTFKRDRPWGIANRAKEPEKTARNKSLCARKALDEKESSWSRPAPVRRADRADSKAGGRDTMYSATTDDSQGSTMYSVTCKGDAPEHPDSAGKRLSMGDKYSVAVSAPGSHKPSIIGIGRTQRLLSLLSSGSGRNSQKRSSGFSTISAVSEIAPPSNLRSDRVSPAAGSFEARKTRPAYLGLPGMGRKASKESNTWTATGSRASSNCSKTAPPDDEDNFKPSGSVQTLKSPSAAPNTWLSQRISNLKDTLIGSKRENAGEGDNHSMLLADEEPLDMSNYYEFHLLEVWNSEASGPTHRMHGQKTMETKKKTAQFEPEQAAPAEVYKSVCMIRPTSSQRVFWDMLSTFFIAYDGIMTPMMFFDLERTGFSIVATWMVRIFWTMDIPITLMTGYTRFDGDLEMRPKQVLLRYLKTWFCPDILVVASDWVEVFIQTEDYTAGGSAARLSKAIRIMRVIRMVRLLRVGRLPLIMERLSVHIPMQVNFFIRAAASVLKIMGIILLLAHCIACFWYFTADSGPHDVNWIRANRLEDSSTIYLYLTAFHWSLTQFSGSMEVAPTNEVERLLAVITLLFSFMVSNVFVSSLTSSMTRFHMVSSRQTKMFAELRRYLERNHISNKLAIRLNIHAAHVFKEQQRNTDEGDIEMLQYVSDALLTDLHYEIYSRWITYHPFFEKCSTERPLLMRRICHQATKMRRFMQGDVIFSSGEAPEPPMMFVTVSGTLHYRPDEDEEEAHLPPLEEQKDSYLPPLEEQKEQRISKKFGRRLSDEEEIEFGHSARCHVLEAGSWLCEGPLWVAWTFLGDLRAIDTVQVMTLEGDTLHRVAERYDELPLFSKYAAAYKDALSLVPANKMTDLGSNSLARKAMQKVHFDDDDVQENGLKSDSP